MAMRLTTIHISPCLVIMNGNNWDEDFSLKFSNYRSASFFLNDFDGALLIMTNLRGMRTVRVLHCN